MILAICLGIFFVPSIAYALHTRVRIPPRRPRPFVGPWVAWRFCTIDPALTCWLVRRRVGETFENLYWPPLGYKDPWTLATFKTGPEARKAAKKANAK